MDTRTEALTEAGRIDAQVEQDIAEIKAYMPETYKTIQERAAERRGVFKLVRDGLRGTPNCFWAMERGRVKGAPFSMPGIQTDVAQAMVEFGCTHACILAMEVDNGAN